jgi:hypothetical protein
MSNVKISQLPEYTGNTSGSWLVMNDSGETTTYKVERETLLSGFQPTGNYATTGSNVFRGDQTITGSLNVSGSQFNIGDCNVSGNLFLNGTIGSSLRTIWFAGSGSFASGANINYSVAGNGNLNLLTTGVGSNINIGTSLAGGTTTNVTINRQNGGSNTIHSSTTLSGSLTVTGSIIQTGSVQGNVLPLSISSNTASLNLDNGNFFTLQLVSGSATHLNPSNIKPGQTVSVFVNTIGSATMTFPSSIKQISGSAYTPTTSTGLDILTLISSDSSNLYLVNAKNFV